jgi:putative ABC transport system substrate-binding protein
MLLSRHTRRREFITLLGGGAAVNWSLRAHAQRPPLPVIGYLYLGTAQKSDYIVTAFRKGLSEMGFVEGRNVEIEFRWANFYVDQLRVLATELVDRKVAVLVTPASTAAVLAAKAATTTIPIVFSTGSDPIEMGFVTSLSRPGGNVTGVTGMTSGIASKRLDLLWRLVPNVTCFGVLVGNPKRGNIASMIAELQAAVASHGGRLEIVVTSYDLHDLDAAFESLTQKSAGALLVSNEFVAHGTELAIQAARHALPAIYSFREDAEAGGLMSYGPSITDNARKVGIYAGRILKGEKPGDLPVMQPTKFEFLINVKTAKGLGLEVPPTLLELADEVIE